MFRYLLVVFALGAGVPAAHAQSSLDTACAAARHHDFDFWIGSWTVTDSTGRVLGTNDIAPIANGCGLREHWRAAGGREGMVLAGERPMPDGPLPDRLTWIPLRAGSVRQQWDVSRDGGETWRRVFDGLYTRNARGADAPP